MARRYQVFGNNISTTSTNKTMLTLISTAAIRATIYDFSVGTEGTPADTSYVFTIQRTTAAGTGGAAVTPVVLDPGDPAATATSVSGSTAITVEPTYTANAFGFGPMGINQRATYRWVAAPGGELIAPSTAAAGWGGLAKSASGTAQADAIFFYVE
jgi:hypothetical protein